MSGILPNNGVAPSGTQNGLEAPILAAGCENLYYGPRCNPRMDPFAMNAMISEIINAVNSAGGQAYDCNRLDNLAIALASLAPPPALVSSMPNTVMQNRAVAGTNIAQAITAAWQTKTLNQKPYDPGLLVTLAGNMFTPIVNGYVRWVMTMQGPGLCKTRLFNVTDNVTAWPGMNGQTALEGATGDDGALNMTGVGFVTAGKQYAIQFRGQTAQGITGGAVNMGEDEVNATVEFYRA